MKKKTRRTFLGSSVAGTLALGLGASPFSTYGSERPRRPNFLVLVTDDQRWDTLREMGNPIIQTPFLDGLARKGVLFTNHFQVRTGRQLSRPTSGCSIVRQLRICFQKGALGAGGTSNPRIAGIPFVQQSSTSCAVRPGDFE